MMDSELAVTSLSALAHRSRLAVFRWLVECGPAGALPSEMAERLGLPAATLSFHLKTLQHAGLVAAKQSSRYLRYTANFAQMQALLGYLSDHCCGGDPSKCLPVAPMADACTPGAGCAPGVDCVPRVA